MEEKVSFDAFKLCQDIISQESEKFENKFCIAEYCKMLDSRDTNFEVVENRLAYIYKYGYFNILFFERCFLIYINQCSEALFPFENLKVCSLSNGPGFDIIGLLSAFRNSNKPLKILPEFNAINLYESWSELYKVLVSKAYETCIVKSFTECFHLNQTNINLIQGDIYSTLSPETKDCISNSNVLLLVNVFISSKANPTTIESSLKEIFTLLRPGSLLFFIGSKNNMKLFSKLTDLKLYVKCIFGPQKVTLNDLPIDEQSSNIIGVKPCDSGHANFIVWQKRNEILKSTHYEQRSSEENIIVECKDDSDTMSELCPSESSITSFVEDRGKSTHDLKSSDKFNSTQISSKMTPISISLNYKVNSVENITSAFSDIKLKPVNCEEQKLKVCQQDILQPHFQNASKTNNIFSENGMSSVEENKVLKEIKKNGISLTNSVVDPVINGIINKGSNINLMNDKEIISQNTSKKKSKKNKVQSLNKTENQSLNKNAEKDNCGLPTTLQKKSFQTTTYENSVEVEKEVITAQATIENLNCTDNSVQLLLQRCDSLISKLEELTGDIKNEFTSSRNAQIINKTHFCNRQIENCQTIHHGCCVKVVHSCCCRKFCKY